jgi:hypothetical protein
MEITCSNRVMKKSPRFQVVRIHINDSAQGRRGPLVQKWVVLQPAISDKCLRIDELLIQFRAHGALDLASFHVIGLDFQNGFRRFQTLFMSLFFDSFSCEVDEANQSRGDRFGGLVHWRAFARL